jgi:hypothetical protein
MDELDDDIESAIVAGQHNLQTTLLVKNWCQQAEITRSPGRGMIEAQYGIPIGHMGIDCKFSKKPSMLCWKLEDSAYDFYKSNCNNCQHRVPVNFPNILEFVTPRLKAEENRKTIAKKRAEQKALAQRTRIEERKILRSSLTLEETFVLDILDDLDQDDVEPDDPRLEKLAHLAPEVFTENVVNYLLNVALNEQFPYSTHAANALVGAPIEVNTKLPVAIRLLHNYHLTEDVIDLVVASVEQLEIEQIEVALKAFASLATESPPSNFMDHGSRRPINPNPLEALYSGRQKDIGNLLGTYLKNSNSRKFQTAIEVLIIIDDKELLSKHTKTIIALLMRRRILLPSERKDSNILFYLRKAASKCLLHLPNETDKFIQAYLEDQDTIGRDEAYDTYDSVFRKFDKTSLVTDSQKVSFNRLLWAAVAEPDNYKNKAIEFFRYSQGELSILAFNNMDELIGAAATLTEKYEQIDKKPTIEVTETYLSEIDKSNKKSSIYNLQSSLIELAAIGAKSQGGIESFMSLYKKIPSNQIQMRGIMISKIATLISDINSLNLVLSDWYKALMDESVLVRSSAIEAWEDTPYDSIKNFPHLFFEAFSIALRDPYVMVHKAAVKALRFRAFPEEKRSLIKEPLWHLIFCYSKESKNDEFVVSCIELLVSLCLSEAELKGQIGEHLSEILLQRESQALYKALNQSRYRFKSLPKFTKVALKAIQDSYVRSITIDDCETVLLESDKKELADNLTDLMKAFEALKPHRPETFTEALLYVFLISKSGNNKISKDLMGELLLSIPKEERSQLWRIETQIVIEAASIECKIHAGEYNADKIERWHTLLSQMEAENEERAQFRAFPPNFFFEG